MALSIEQQFFDAARAGDLGVVEELAADAALNINWQEPSYGYTALNIACAQRCVSVVEFLLKDPKVEINKSQIEGGTPFLIACQQGHKEVVSLLLADVRTEVNKPMNDGGTPFFMTCQDGHKEVVSLLLNDERIDVSKPRNDGCTPFYIACQDGHHEVVSLLLNDLRIEVNQPQKDQRTPLWVASQFGHLPVIQLILASGRKLATQTRSVAGPAHWNNKTAAEIGRRQGTRAKIEGESDEEYTRRKQNGPLIATLIDSYEQNSQQVRAHLRKQLGLNGSRFSSSFFFLPFLLLVFSSPFSPTFPFVDLVPLNLLNPSVGESANFFLVFSPFFHN